MIQGSLYKQLLNIIKSLLGHEFEAIIISTFEPLEENGTSSNPTKSLVDPKIFNTVLSRSKSLVVAVGNPYRLLRMEKQMGFSCWKAYLANCLKNDTVFFPERYRKSDREHLKLKLAAEVDVIVTTMRSNSSPGWSHTQPALPIRSSTDPKF